MYIPITIQDTEYILTTNECNFIIGVPNSNYDPTDKKTRKYTSKSFYSTFGGMVDGLVIMGLLESEAVTLKELQQELQDIKATLFNNLDIVTQLKQEIANGKL